MAKTSPSNSIPLVGRWALLALLPIAQAGALTLEEQVRQCAAVSDEGQRLACYDTLGGQLQASPASADVAAERPVSPPVPPPDQTTAPAAAAVAASPRKTPDENLGGYQFKDPEEDPNEMAMITRVVDCEKERGSGSWYFRFENDQVWKQVDRRTLNFQGCDFPVKVLSDGFGYVMRIEGREGKIRVSRRK